MAPRALLLLPVLAPVLQGLDHALRLPVMPVPALPAGDVAFAVAAALGVGRPTRRAPRGLFS